MMTPLELKRLVRFGLAQMRAENAHHDFELLCSYVARARISLNLVPATGPVGAGGDGGRDAETVPALGEIESTAELGDFAGKVVVLCCTLQQKRVSEKIRNDVDAVLSNPDLTVDVVVAFCEADVPVGVRDKLRSEVKRAQGVDLFVIDGNAISEWLAAPDLIWLAHRFLDLPSEALPNPAFDESDVWYLEERTAWADRLPVTTWGEFESLRQLLRYSYQHSGHLADLDWWLDLTAPFADASVAPSLRRAAIYELAIARMRAKGDVDPCADLLVWYFDTISEVEPSGMIEDAQVLLAFCFSYSVQDRSKVIAARYLSWQGALTTHVDAQIRATENPARLFSLLLARGALELLSGVFGPFSQIAEFWGRALSFAQDATMLPIERLSDRLTPIAPAYSSDQDYWQLVSRADSLVAKQSGEFAVGHQAIDRGAALVEADQVVSALGQFHGARLHFLAAHETERVLSVTVVIGSLYQRLGLWWAAKQYFLAIAGIATAAPEADCRRYLAIGLAGAAKCDYETGAWSRTLDLTFAALRAHDTFDQDPWDPEKHPFLNQLTFDLGMLTAASMHHAPAVVRDRAVGLTRTFFPPEILDELESDPPEWIADRELLARRYADDKGVRPFDDLCEERRLTWAALGAEWTIVCDNAQGCVAAAERFAATLQILQAEIAGFDTALLPMHVTIRVGVGPEPGLRQPGDPEPTFEIDLLEWQGGDHEHLRFVAAATFTMARLIIGFVSTADEGSVDEEVRRLLDDDVSNRLTFFQMYDELLLQWHEPSTAPIMDPIGPVPAPPAEHPELAAHVGPGPGYTREAAEEALANRYRNLVALTRPTLNRLRAAGRLDALVGAGRERGWLDWHILGAILSVVTSHRMNGDVLRAPDRQPDMTVRAENDDDPPPIGDFTVDALETGHRGNNVVTLVNTWDRPLRLRFVSPDAVERLLAIRYRHYTDDITHDDPFG